MSTDDDDDDLEVTATQLSHVATDGPVTLESLERDILIIRWEALNASKGWMRKDGTPFEAKSPDFRAALQATELLAKLLGIGGTGAGADVAAVKRELERMGLEVRPKRLRAVE